MLCELVEIKKLSCLVPALALAIDMLLGDPPNRWHPVAWLGTMVFAFKRIAPKKGKLIPMFYGIAFLLLGSLALGCVLFLLAKLIDKLPLPITLLLEALLLKFALSVKGLKRAAKEVFNALQNGDLDEGRRLVAWHLVSRDTRSLDEGHVVSATVESVAENLTDSIVGPIFWWLLLGLPGVWIYRFINTSDSILGYRTEELEWLGKGPARIDDIANFIPARLSAFFLILSALFMRRNPVRGISVMFKDHKLTSSPNAGWTMSAMAGILNVKLEKIGNYCLNQNAELPLPEDIILSVALMQISALISAMMGFLRCFVYSLTSTNYTSILVDKLNKGFLNF